MIPESEPGEDAGLNFSEDILKIGGSGDQVQMNITRIQGSADQVEMEESRPSLLGSQTVNRYI